MRRTTATVTLLLALIMMIVSFGSTPASATPWRQGDCSQCHGAGGYAGTLTAQLSAAVFSPGASYLVDIAISPNPVGTFGTGYWIASSTAGGLTGPSTGVYAQSPGSHTFVAHMTAPTTSGVHYYKVFGEDGPPGMLGQTSVGSYAITVLDVVAPSTSRSGAGKAWRRRTAMVLLSAVDDAGGSGVATTEYSLDGGASWQVGNRVTVVADPLTHATDGIHIIHYRSTDSAGNVETPKTLTVRLDTVKPVPRLRRLAEVRRGAMAAVKYRIGDTAPNGGIATGVLRITTAQGRTVKVVRTIARRVNADLTLRFRCRLAAGTYRFRLHAKDKAGNPSAKAAMGRLLVRP